MGQWAAGAPLVTGLCHAGGVADDKEHGGPGAAYGDKAPPRHLLETCWAQGHTAGLVGVVRAAA